MSNIWMTLRLLINVYKKQLKKYRQMLNVLSEFRILQLMLNQGPNIYTILSFEGSSLDNEKVQNFEHFGTPASFFGGLKSKFGSNRNFDHG